jgi:hypothetical protein
MLLAAVIDFLRSKGVSWSELTQEKLGMCLSGKPLPKTLQHTPMLEAVLNMVLIPDFE